MLLMAVVLSVAWSQAVLPRTFRFRDDFFSGPDSVWRRNVSGLAPTAHSFQQVEAAYTVLKVRGKHNTVALLTQLFFPSLFF